MNSENNNTNRPFRLSSQQILDDVNARVLAWENGTAASPSAGDFADIIGRRNDDDFTDELFDVLVHGADEQELADFLWERQP